MSDGDVNRQLLLADTAVSERQILLESLSVMVAKMSRDGLNTADARRQLRTIEETLRRDVELRDQLREKLRRSGTASNTGH